jgi:hypothetical protein
VRIAYLTIDEVNQNEAQRVADRYGVGLYPLSPRDPPPNGQFEAVLYDLDYLPPQQLQAILGVLLSKVSDCPVALHSYNLDEEQATALRNNGIGVFRHLEPAMLRLLAGRQMGTT